MLAYTYLVDVTTIAGSEPLPAGPATIAYNFAWDGGKRGAGRTGTLSTGKRSQRAGSSTPFRLSSV
jgi:hypothetical protein